VRAFRDRIQCLETDSDSSCVAAAEEAPKAVASVEEKKIEESKPEIPALGEVALPPVPSRPGTLRNEEPVEQARSESATAAVEVEEATSGRIGRTTAARRVAFKKKEFVEQPAVVVEEEPAPAARARATRSKKGAAGVTSEVAEDIAPAEPPKRRGRPKKAAAAAASVVELELEAPVPVEQIEVQEIKLDLEDAKKKRKVSETVAVDVVVLSQPAPPVSPAPIVASSLSPKIKSPSRVYEDEIVIESETEAVAAVVVEEPAAIVVSEAAFTSPTEPEVVAVTPEQQKKRTRSASIKANSRPVSPVASIATVQEADVNTTPGSAKRRKLSTATDAASEPQTPPPEVPVLPTEEIFSGSKLQKKSPKQSKSPTNVVVDSKRATRSQKSSPVSFTVSAPPSYAESLELLRKELPAIEAVLRMDREEAATATSSSNMVEVTAPVVEEAVSTVEAVEDKMDVDIAADEKSVEEPRRTSGKRKRSSADRSSTARLSSSSGAPSLVSSSSSDNLIQPRATGSSMAPPASSRVVPPASKAMPGAKPVATQKGAVDEKLKKVIENRNLKEQERIQKQLEKIKKQEEKQSRIAEQKTAATVQDKVKEAQRRKEELKKKQQEKKKPAAVAAAPALTKKASAEEMATESAPVDAPVQPIEQEAAVSAPKSTPLKNLIAKFSSNPVSAPAPTAVVAPAPAIVKDTPSKGSSIKSLFAALNPLSLLSSFGSAKKQKAQDELPKPNLNDDDDDTPRRQSAPGSPSVSKSPLFSLTEGAKSPIRASTGSNHDGFDEPPSASKKGKKKSKTPKKPASAKKVKTFGWNKPSTLAHELPTPNLMASSSSSALTKKVNLSPSDLPSPGPPPAMSKTAAEIMPPPKLPAIGSPSWIRLQTKDQAAPGSPYQSPEKPKQQGKFHQSPEFQYKIDEYSSDQDSPEKMMGPEWTKKEQLWEALVRQSAVDPDDVFGTDFPKTCDLAEIFATDKTSAEDRRRYRHRTSSGNWTRDKLHTNEDLHYKKRMGFHRSPTK
jgi:hypothetical protein